MICGIFSFLLSRWWYRVGRKLSSVCVFRMLELGMLVIMMLFLCSMLIRLGMLRCEEVLSLSGLSELELMWCSSMLSCFRFVMVWICMWLLLMVRLLFLISRKLR